MVIATLEIPVASAIYPAMKPQIVKVSNASNFHQAVRLAVQYAQRQLHIAAPVVPYTEHEFAMMERRRLLATRTPKLGNLNGNSVPFWKQPERAPLYAGR